MIELDNITKRFADGQRSLTVLDHLSLRVEAGEFIAINGESGSGKTTLLSILGTLLQPDEGRYLLHGEEVVLTTNSKQNDKGCYLRNKEIGFVYQDHRLLPQYTVWQNILLPTLADKKASTQEEVKHALELMEFTGIAPLKDSNVTQLSGGEQSRVAICRALINHPSILLADEPTGQLDAANAQNIALLFQNVNAKFHTTIIMATHSAEMAKAAKKTFTLIQGKLVASALDAVNTR